ncbi:MAG: GYF domain-containing protein [Polyangiaceae bacterium]
MSRTEWRFTDDQGVERVVDTDELRASLTTGKVAASTPVWREGMSEWQPAFTIPELSSAAIASARRSVPPGGLRSAPPPLPEPRGGRAKPRPMLRTLTGIEPLALETADIMPDSAKNDGADDPRASQRDLPALVAAATEAEWEDDQTDVIPRAPKLPREVKIPAIKSATPTPPPGVLSKSEENIPKTKTLMGTGQRQGKPVLRQPTVPADLVAPKAAPTPPSPPKKGRSEPPPPPRRNRTLEMSTASSGASPAPVKPAATTMASSGTPATSAAGRSKPPPPPNRQRTTARMDNDAHAAASSASANAAPGSVARPNHPSPPRPPHTQPQTSSTAASSLANEPTALSVPSPGASTSSSPAPRSVTSEGTEIMPAPNSEALQRAAAAFKASENDPDDVPTSKPRQARTLEMALEDHSKAASKDPAPPESQAPPKTEESGSKLGGVTKSIPARSATDEPSSRKPSTPPRRSRERVKGALEVPMSTVLAVSSVWMLGLVAFFFVGRVSGYKSANRIPIARDGLDQAFTPPIEATSSAAAPVASEEPKAAAPLPCWVTRQAVRWAPSASKAVPFDLRAAAGSMLVGYAAGEHEGVGLKVDARSGKFEEVFRSKVDGTVAHVVSVDDNAAFEITARGDRTFTPVVSSSTGATNKTYLVLEKGSIGAATSLDGEVKQLWALEGDDPVAAEQVQRVGEDFLVTFRRGDAVYGGYFGVDLAPKGALVKIAGSGGRSGKPRAATNGIEVAVAFADRVDEKEETPWEIRVGRSRLGSVPESAALVPMPPDGESIAPDIVGLPDGRWLLMWTQGPSGKRAIRAQAFDMTFAPIGDPIALSPPGGSFGQAVLGVVGNYTTVAFLQAGEDDGFEMWGAVLQCGL